jgi:hypothetical protein
MTTPTGRIQASDINAELGRAWNTPFNLNDGPVRALAGNAGGHIDFNQLRGRSAYTSMTGQGNDDSAGGSLGEGSVQFVSTVHPSVTVSNGAPGYSYQWSFIDAGGATFGGTTTASYVAVQHTISRFGYSGSATLRCVVTDSTGRTLSIEPVYASWDYYDNG